MKKFVKDGRIYYIGITPDEAQKLWESRFSEKVKSMDNKHLLMTFFHQMAKHNEDWKLRIIMREIFIRMNS